LYYLASGFPIADSNVTQEVLRFRPVAGEPFRTLGNQLGRWISIARSAKLLREVALLHDTFQPSFQNDGSGVIKSVQRPIRPQQAAKRATRPAEVD
jgi:hypothetical protein